MCLSPTRQAKELKEKEGNPRPTQFSNYALIYNPFDFYIIITHISSQFILLSTLLPFILIPIGVYLPIY